MAAIQVTVAETFSNGNPADSKVKVGAGSIATASSTQTYLIAPIAATGSAGTSNAFARADHTHAGVHSVQGDAATALLGDVKLASGTDIKLATVGQTITINKTTGYAEARNTATQAIPNTTLTRVQFTTVDASSGVTVDTTTNIGRATPTVAGWYRVTSSTSFGTVLAAGEALLEVMKNGSAIHGSTQVVGGTGTGLGTGDRLTVTSSNIQCNGTTDFIEVWVSQSSGGASSIGGEANVATRLTIDYMHA